MQSSALSERCVHKFGGASLADGERIRRVGELMVERAPDRPIVVVSAVEGVTSQLDLLAREAALGVGDMARLRVRHRSLLAQLELDSEHLNRHFAELATVLNAIRNARQLSQAQRDHVLSFGERASARIVAAHLSQRGLRAMPIDAYDLGLVTDSNHGRARVLPHSAAQIRDALARIDAICVITGFVAADANGRLTTLGRNGSDVSAALIGEAIGAREIVFWKEVGGVMRADPKLVPAAQRLERLSYQEARELTHHGANVLHPEAVEVLERGSIAGRVRCTRTPDDEGTRVEHRESTHEFVGVASRSNLALLRARPADAATHAKLADALARHGVEPLVRQLDERDVKAVAPLDDALMRACDELGACVELVREVGAVAVVDRREVGEVSERSLGASEVAILAAWRSGAWGSRVYAVRQAQLSRAVNALHQRLTRPLSELRDVS
jgi:aspartate kinase